MKNDWQVNDWCFCEFKLQQITRIEDGRITTVSDGFFTLGSNSLNDRCFPLDMKIKRASDEAEMWTKKIREIGTGGLNYPDIHRKIISLWCDVCVSIHDNTQLTMSYGNLESFANSVLKSVREIQYQHVDGVQLFKTN